MRPATSLIALLLVVALCGAASAQAPPPQKDIDKAIDKGCRYLMATMDRHLKDYEYVGHKFTSAPLVLVTLLKGKVSKKSAAVRQLLAYSYNHPLDKVYVVSLLAIGLEAMGEDKFAGKIGQCAQFLVDNQCKNGQWGYGKPVPLPAPTRPRKSRGTSVKTPVTVRTPSDEKEGDNSNTQYALLGLRSCEMAGFETPKETWEKALKWWKSEQRDEGGWNYGNDPNEPSYLSMSSGGLGSVVICLHYLGRNWVEDESVKKARKFLAENLSMERNFVLQPQEVDCWHYYYLYALERAGNLMSTETFGNHAWYAEGANYLLKKQQPDGHWKYEAAYGNEVWDTCFAVLFLARGTPPVVATGTAKEHKAEGEKKK